MKKINNYSLIFMILSAISFAFFSSCKNENAQQTDSDYFELTANDSNIEKIISKPEKCKITNKKILVLFGYNFNSPETVQNLTSLLEQHFGLEADGGMIYALTYPNDFKHNSNSYVNDLYSILQSNDRELSAVVILGAPEKTHLALARNQDKWNNHVPYPVAALFPQDEGLGLESTCDFVLDKGQTEHVAFSDNADEEIEAETIQEAPQILLSTVSYLSKMKSSLPRDSTIQQHAKQMFKDFIISYYVDTETGLPSVNHFVLK